MGSFKLMLTVVAAVCMIGSAGAQYDGLINGLILDEQDGFEISFGTIIEGFLGQQNLLVPIWITNEDPVEYVHLELQYDASLIQPTLIAPALFYQHFNYDISVSGRISLELECNLVPPPNVPPIAPGEAIIAYILMNVMVHDLGRDVTTELTFYENPSTPFPDNFIMLENQWFIVPPQLLLTNGYVFIYNPIYGDINLNNLPYEIGDVIMFISFLSGQIEFTARQMANSDCNRDGIQATISDLVYMLNVINGNLGALAISLPAYSNPLELSRALKLFQGQPARSHDGSYIVSISADLEEPLGGFTFKINTSKLVSQVGDAMLGRDLEDFLMASTVSDGTIKVVGCSQYLGEAPSGNLELVRIPLQSSNRLSADDFKVIGYDFSDASGRMINVEFRIQLESPDDSDRDSGDYGSSIQPVAYPNPFNSRVLVSFVTIQPGPVSVEIFDILGRKVQTLKDRFEQAGQKHMIWNGMNEEGNNVSAGIYLCRIRLDEMEKVIKLQYLK